MAGYADQHPADAAELERWLSGRLPQGWEEDLPVFAAADGPMATRAAGGKVLNAIAPRLPELIGGSADLAPSTKTLISGSGDLRGRGEKAGRNIHFGVREHAMAAAVNGMALHGGVRPYGATFFVFSDYMRPSLRLAALMGYVFTHDSLAVGEDGPTHQPVEHLASLRAMPGMTTVRPADAGEVAGAWHLALTRPGPVCLVLSRQKLPILDPRLHPTSKGVARGGYVLQEEKGELELVIIASGAEVHPALEAAQRLGQEGRGVRVVSLPSWEVFAEQDQAYRDSVLPPGAAGRLAVEAGASLGWERWVGPRGRVIGVDRFGHSAPGSKVLAEYGFSTDHVAETAREMLGG
jgi:transketolase